MFFLMQDVFIWTVDGSWAALSSPGSGIILSSQQKLPELLAKHSNDGKSQLSSTATFVQ